MKNVLITGGAGFIGSRLVDKFLEKNYHVTVLDNLSSSHKQFNKNVKFHKVDLTKSISLQKYFNNIDICVHLAAKIGGVGYFHKYPGYILDENNKILSNVFNASRDAKLGRVVYVSSSMVYESSNKFPLKESDLSKIAMPITSYGFSKLAGEVYCRSYFEQYNLNYTIVRPFNAYGPGELPSDVPGISHVIPDLVKKIKENPSNVKLIGSGNQTRSFTYIDDLVDGIYEASVSKNSINDDFNIASNHNVRIKDLALKIGNIMGVNDIRLVASIGPNNDVIKRTPSVVKAKKILGWKASMSLDNGLKKTISWIENNDR